MNKIVIIGAGQTGRGYLNRFFAGNPVTFLDKDEALVEKLKENASYRISFGEQGAEDLVMKNYDAYLTGTKEALQCLAEADMILVSVGRKNLNGVYEVLKESLKLRVKGDVDILTAENGIRAKESLLPLCADRRVHLADAIVFCTTVKKENTLDILSENLEYLPYDVVALGHRLPYKNMVPEEKLDVLMQRKLYTYNCVSAIVSYLGYYKKYEIYSEAANDKEITWCIEEVLESLNDCICREYEIPEEEQQKFAEMAVRKFQNKNIVDTIERNARDADRKLGEGERIVTPLCILNKYGKNSPALLLVAACAVYYGLKTNTLRKKADEYFEALPEEWRTQIKVYLEELSGNKSVTELIGCYRTKESGIDI